jgi:hypothetical protein
MSRPIPENNTTPGVSANLFGRIPSEKQVHQRAVPTAPPSNARWSLSREKSVGAPLLVTSQSLLTRARFWGASLRYLWMARVVMMTP